MWNGTHTNSTKTWAGIVMEAEVKAVLMRDVETFLCSEAWYARMGLAWTRGYIFHGPPGTGKTSSALAISQAAKVDLYNLDLKAVKSNEHLVKLVALIPCRAVIVMEDIDAMSDVVLSRRRGPAKDGTGHQHAIPAALSSGFAGTQSPSGAPSSTTQDAVTVACDLTLSGLLNALNGIVCGCGRIVVMTTNHIEKLDSALIRPGRIDVKVHMGLCSGAMIAGMYDMFFSSGGGLTVDSVAVVGTVLEGLVASAGGLLTPAEVSSVFLAHRFDARAALVQLDRALRVARAGIDMRCVHSATSNLRP
ncbi:MAG: hypothetical protein WDW38_006407 [Sanguina aurantia]